MTQAGPEVENGLKAQHKNTKNNADTNRVSFKKCLSSTERRSRKKTVGTTRLPTLSNNPFAGFCEALIDYPFHRQISAPQTISKQKHHTITICNVWPTHIHPRHTVIFPADDCNIVFRFHYHSQKVIGSLGHIFYSPIFNGFSRYKMLQSMSNLTWNCYEVAWQRPRPSNWQW